MRYILENPEVTMNVANKLGRLVKPGDVLALTGDLGVGKTTFTKGLGVGMGIKTMIKSPTYTLIREYEGGRLPLYHMDVYRLTGGASDLGLDEYFEGDGVSVLEWGKQIMSELPDAYLEVILSRSDDNQVRYLSLIAKGTRYSELASQLVEDLKELGLPIVD